MVSRLAEASGAFLVYTGLTAVFLRPFHRVWRDHLTPDLGDPLFNLYVLEWVQRQVRLGLPDLFGANFFFPYDDPLLLSDHLFGIAVQALALRPLTGGDPVATYNLLLFLAFPLSALAAAAVARACGFSRSAALVGGAVYGFAPYHWSQLSHLQVLTYQWVPPTLWFFDRLLAAPRSVTAALFLVFYTLHVTGGSYLAYMIHIPLLVLLSHRALSVPGWRSLATRRSLRVLLPTGLAASSVTMLVFLPYLQASHRIGPEWAAENYRIFGATLLALLTPSPFNPHFDVAARLVGSLGLAADGDLWFGEKSLFVGTLAGILTGVGAWRLRRRRVDHRTSTGPGALAWASAAIGLFVLADLYTLGWWPSGLPDALHDPDNVYTLLGGALLASLAAWAVLRLRARNPPRERRESPGRLPERGLLLAGGVALLFCFPVVYEPISEILPGFSNMRVPARFFPFALFAAALLSARGTDYLASRVPGERARALAATALFALLVVELAPREMPWLRVPPEEEAAEVYAWISEQPDVEALLELPLLPPPHEVRYMVRSTIHWKPIVNGFSGRFPPHYAQLQRRCCWPVPNTKVLDDLRAWGVTHLVIHPIWTKRWQQRAYREWVLAVESGQIEDVRQVFSDPATGDAVFDIRFQPRPQAASPRGLRVAHDRTG